MFHTLAKKTHFLTLGGTANVHLGTRRLLQPKQYSWIAFSFISASSARHCLISLFSLMLFDRLKKKKKKGPPRLRMQKILPKWWIQRQKKNRSEVLTSALHTAYGGWWIPLTGQPPDTAQRDENCVTHRERGRGGRHRYKCGWIYTLKNSSAPQIYRSHLCVSWSLQETASPRCILFSFFRFSVAWKLSLQVQMTSTLKTQIKAPTFIPGRLPLQKFFAPGTVQSVWFTSRLHFATEGLLSGSPIFLFFFFSFRPMELTAATLKLWCSDVPEQQIHHYYPSAPADGLWK